MKGKRQNSILGNIPSNARKDPTNIKHILITKIEFIQEIIRNTILSIKNNKTEELFSNNDSVLSTSILIELYNKADTLEQTLTSTTCNTDEVIEKLQQIINKLSVLICGFGTTYIEDLLFISFGSDFKNTQT